MNSFSPLMHCIQLNCGLHVTVEYMNDDAPDTSMPLDMILWVEMQKMYLDTHHSIHLHSEIAHNHITWFQGDPQNF